MILLDNYSKKNTFIKITTEGYSIVDTKNIGNISHGEGGFSEDGELLGLYVYDNKLYFKYNNKKYETEANKINCTNKHLDNGKRNFKVKINDVLVCDIIYKPYISPFVLTFGDDEDEFDFLLYLSKIMIDEVSILEFINGINNLKNHYSK